MNENLKIEQECDFTQFVQGYSTNQQVVGEITHNSQDHAEEDQVERQDPFGTRVLGLIRRID